MSEKNKRNRSSVRTRGFGLSVADKYLFKAHALSRGKRVMETIPNPDATLTNKPFIRVQSRRLRK